MTWVRAIPVLFVLLVVSLAACEDETCRRHSDCEPPELCVDQRCWVALCSPDDPICPEGTSCEDGWCHAGGDAGSDAEATEGDAEATEGDAEATEGDSGG